MSYVFVCGAFVRSRPEGRGARQRACCARLVQCRCDPYPPSFLTAQATARRLFAETKSCEWPLTDSQDLVPPREHAMQLAAAAAAAAGRGLEDMGAVHVAAWLRDEVKLPQYAAAAEERGVDGGVLLNLIARDGLAGQLGVSNGAHQSKISAHAAQRSRRKRAAPDTAVKAGAARRAKRARGAT